MPLSTRASIIPLQQRLFQPISLWNSRALNPVLFAALTICTPYSLAQTEQQKAQNAEYKRLSEATQRAFAIPNRPTPIVNNSRPGSTGSGDYQSNSGNRNRTTNSLNSSGNSNEGGTGNNSWADTSQIDRQREAGARNDALISAFEEKLERMEKLIKSRNLVKSRENYQAIFNCAIEAGLDQYTAGRTFGFDANEYQAMLDRQSSRNPKSSSIYEGSTKSNCDGDCKETLYYKDKSGQYLGNTKGGKPNGKGVLTLSNGDQFTGNFVDGTLQGNIVLRFADGNLYEGGFNRTAFFGQGKFTWKDGATDEGMFQNSKLNGPGKRVDRRGGIFMGEFKDGVESRGIFSNEKLSFQGIFQTNGKNLLVGQSINKLNNEMSESFFNSAGQKHGYRIDYRTNQRINEAIYINDKNAGPIRYTNADGDLLIGTTAQEPYQMYGLVKSTNNQISLGALTRDGSWITLPESERENVMRVFNATIEALAQGRAKYEAALKL